MTQSTVNTVEDYMEFFTAMDIEFENIGYIFGDYKWLSYGGSGEWLQDVIIPNMADEVRLGNKIDSLKLIMFFCNVKTKHG